MTVIESLLRSVGDSIGVWLYLVAGLLAFGEAAILIGVVAPGETALLIAGVFCNPHYGRLVLPAMIAVGVVAAVGGDSVGYEFGRAFGPSLRGSQLGRWVGEHRWAKVDRFLHRHGGKAVLIGRMTALLRALTPSLAGMSGMRYRTFLTWNAIGGLIWAPGCVLLGYAFASALSAVSETLTWLPVVIVVLAAGAYLWLHARRRRAEQAR